MEGVPPHLIVPQSKRLLQGQPEELIIPGQGVVTFSLQDKLSTVIFTFSKPKEDFPRLSFTLTQETGRFYWELNESTKTEIQTEKRDPLIPDNFMVGISTENLKTRYWISIDSWNKTLRYGKGEARLGCVLIEKIYGEAPTLFSKPEDDKYPDMKLLKRIGCSEKVMLHSCWAQPVVKEPPVAVVQSDDYTMEDAASPGYIGEGNRVYEVGKATIPSLSHECQRLHGNISSFNLDFNFVQALEYSLRDENGLGWKILKYKLDHSEFGEPNHSAENTNEYTYKEIYLRITFGKSQGDSPGVPFVMEIWPGGCGSPIHNHGGTYAIIKVLHGQIDIDLHRMLPLAQDSTLPFRHLQFEKGDITFITPQANQYHRLRNLKQHTTTCVTIQCYSYPDDDKVHDPYFHYVEVGKPGDFNPVSDYDFLSFKREVMEKWINDGCPTPNLSNMWWQTYNPTTIGH